MQKLAVVTSRGLGGEQDGCRVLGSEGVELVDAVLVLDLESLVGCKLCMALSKVPGFSGTHTPRARPAQHQQLSKAQGAPEPGAPTVRAPAAESVAVSPRKTQGDQSKGRKHPPRTRPHPACYQGAAFAVP